MILFVSGATTTVRQHAASPHLGHLLSPASGNRLDVLLATGLPLAVDNGAFTYHAAGRRFPVAAYARFIGQLAAVWHERSARGQALRDRLRFVVAPDRVGDAAGTARLWRAWLDGSAYAAPWCPPAARRLPWAYVLQDGQRCRDLPWQAGSTTRPAALFLGGSTAYKESAAAAHLIREAKRCGYWVHIGRVNSERRRRHFDGLGADSFDGGQYSMFPQTYIPRELARLAWKQQTMEV